MGKENKYNIFFLKNLHISKKYRIFAVAKCMIAQITENDKTRTTDRCAAA